MWQVNRESRWSPPPHKVLKININGSSQGNHGHVGIGEVGWDSYGDAQFIFCVYKGFHANNLMEALPILYVVERSCALS